MFVGTDAISAAIRDVVSEKFNRIVRSESRCVRSDHRACIRQSIPNEHEGKCRNPCEGIEEAKAYSTRLVHRQINGRYTTIFVHVRYLLRTSDEKIKSSIPFFFYEYCDAN